MENCRQLLHGGAFDVQNEVFDEFLHGGLFHEFHEHEHLAIILPHAVKLTVAGVSPLHKRPCPVELDLSVVVAFAVTHGDVEALSLRQIVVVASDKRCLHGDGNLDDVALDCGILFVLHRKTSLGICPKNCLVDILLLGLPYRSSTLNYTIFT